MSISIILVGPQMGENIGAAARVMRNFGFSDLRIVAPRDGWPNPVAIDMATIGAEDIVRKAGLFATLEEAIADLHYVAAVTARPRDMVKPVHTPRDLKLPEGKCGIVFGRERNGLTNEEVVLADSIVTIPTDPNYSSLNLAQAVAVLCYELSEGRGQGAWNEDSMSEPALSASGTSRPIAEASRPERGALKHVPAPKAELLAMLEHFEQALEENGAFESVEKKKPKMLANLNNMFTRAALTRQEVQSMRGVIRVLTGSKQGH